MNRIVGIISIALAAVACGTATQSAINPVGQEAIKRSCTSKIDGFLAHVDNTSKGRRERYDIIDRAGNKHSVSREEFRAGYIYDCVKRKMSGVAPTPLEQAPLQSSPELTPPSSYVDPHTVT